MIARSEHEFNIFNEMDIERRERESCYGVGHVSDEVNEFRMRKIYNIDDSSQTLSKRNCKKVEGV